MKLNRVLSAFVLTGLFSVAGMAARAQTRVMVRFGTPVAGVVANFMSPHPGRNYVWVNGYYSGMQWIPGQWVYRVNSRYQRRDQYRNRNARFYSNNRNGYYGNHNDRYNNRNNQRDRNGRNAYGRNRGNRWNRGNRGNNWNRGNDRGNGYHQRGNRGGRH